jgi:hypothetical protein
MCLLCHINDYFHERRLTFFVLLNNLNNCAGIWILHGRLQVPATLGKPGALRPPA